MSSEMEECKVFNKKIFDEILGKVEGLDIKELEVCPDTTGGKRRRKKSRKMRGGWRPTRAQIRMALWIIIGAIFAYIGITSDKTTITHGLDMLIKGKCTNPSELFFTWWGVGNPICKIWNSLVAVVLLALSGSPGAIAQLVGVAAGMVAAPTISIMTVDSIAGQIERQVIALIGNEPLAVANGVVEEPRAINNEPLPPGLRRRAIANANANDANQEDVDAANILLGMRDADHEHIDGGRSRRRMRRTRRHKKHTRRHKRHSRRR